MFLNKQQTITDELAKLNRKQLQQKQSRSHVIPLIFYSKYTALGVIQYT